MLVLMGSAAEEASSVSVADGEMGESGVGRLDGSGDRGGSGLSIEANVTIIAVNHGVEMSRKFADSPAAQVGGGGPVSRYAKRLRSGKRGPRDSSQGEESAG